MLGIYRETQREFGDSISVHEKQGITGNRKGAHFLTLNPLSVDGNPRKISIRFLLGGGNHNRFLT